MHALHRREYNTHRAALGVLFSVARRRRCLRRVAHPRTRNYPLKGPPLKRAEGMFE